MQKKLKTEKFANSFSNELREDSYMALWQKIIKLFVQMAVNCVSRVMKNSFSIDVRFWKWVDEAFEFRV